MMEEEKIKPTYTEITAIMVQLHNIRMRYFEDRKQLLESEKVLVVHREQLRQSREAEQGLRRKAEGFQECLINKQNIIGSFLRVTEENIELSKKNTQLEKEKVELLNKIKADQESWQQREESLKSAHKKELEDLKSFSEKKAQDARSDLDVYRTEYDMKRKEIETKFQTLQKEKRAQLDIAMQIRDDKIQTMGEQMTSMMQNHDQQRKEIVAKILMLQDKNVELERKLMQMEIKARLKAPPTADVQYSGNADVQQQPYRYNYNSALPPKPMSCLTVTKKGGPATTSGGGNACRTMTEVPGGGRKGQSNIQPLEFVDEDKPKKTVTFGGRGAVPKKRKLYNPNDKDDYLL